MRKVELLTLALIGLVTIGLYNYDSTAKVNTLFLVFGIKTFLCIKLEKRTLDIAIPVTCPSPSKRPLQLT